MAREFDDTAFQYLEIDSAVLANEPFTMACWFDSDDITGSQALMCINDKDITDNHYHVLIAEGTIGGDPVRARTRVGGVAGNADSTAGFTANTWYHACGVWAADNDRRAYIDGGNRGNDATNLALAGIDRTSIGRQGDATPERYMSGAIAEAAIWNVALTDAEVAVLAVGVRPVFVRPGSLIFYMPLIRDDDEDLVGGLSLAANNGPTVVAHCPMYYTASGLVSFAPAVGVVPALAMHHYRKRRSKN